MLEVGVTVEEGEAIATPAAQSEDRSEHDAAVATKQDGKAAAVERGVHGTGNVACDRRNPLRIEDSGRRVTHVVVRRYVNTHDTRGAETLVEARPAERVRSIFQSARTKTERRRHIDYQRIHRL